LLLITLCLHIAARGQTEWRYDYWFDNDRTTLKQGSSHIDSWRMDADISSLSESLHTFHFQVMCADTLPSIPVTRYFIKFSNQSNASTRYWFDDDVAHVNTISSQAGTVNLDVSRLPEGLHTLHVQVLSGEGTISSTASRLFYKTFLSTGIQGQYWFDDDIANKHISPQAQGLFDIDVRDLEEGFHTIHYQVVGTGGHVSSMVSRSFYKIYLSEGISWRCWFDNDFSTVQEGEGVGSTLLLDVTQIADGYHTLHVQVDGSPGVSSVPVTKGFVKVPQTIGVDDYTCLCMVDDQLYKQEKVPAGGGIVAWNFDVSQLPQGFHRMFIQVVTPSGAASNAYESFFLREATHSELAEMKCVYAIDGAEFKTEAGTVSNGAFHFDLDVASLEDGLHRISYMLSNGKGVSTKTQTQFFMKTPLGGNGIMEYWYWQNEQGDSLARKVRLAERKNPFSLISLLPVESLPIRSSSFEFKVKDGQPTIFAKNDIHLRFYDAAGRFTDISKQYVDENMKQEVTDITLLQSGVRATTAKPAENAIKWYCVEAESGDSLQFKLNRAASIQLFAPSGEEVHAVSGSESVKWKGLHVRESGVYYLALHDVTAQQGTTVSIDYNHIDKYAVLRQNISTVGNGGFSTITFEGNGFLNLYEVAIISGNDTIVRHHEIEYLSDATIRVWFDFSDVPVGIYDITFNFGNESRILKRAICVETAKDIEIAAKVSYPSTFLMGTSVTYTYEISNHGNMTAYGVPVYLSIESGHRQDISRIDINGLPHPDYLTDIQGLTDEERSAISQMRSNSGDEMYFYEREDSNGHTSRDNYFFIEIAPGQTERVSVTVCSKDTVSIKMDVPDACPPLRQGKEYPSEQQRTLRDQYCCVRDRIECALGVTSDIAGMIGHLVPEGTPVSTVAGAVNCAASVASSLSENVGYYLCRDYDGNEGLSVSAENYNRFRHGANLMTSIIGCIAPDHRHPAQQIIEDGRQLANDTRECIQAFGSKKERCLPTKSKGGKTQPVRSYDPNEIYGYIADSGSNAISTEKTDVYYTIQFENDTKFATAAAHDIYLVDTLDATKFDLSTFAPTRVKIGDKSAELTGEKNFVTTIDMRPEINAIAQVEGTYDQMKGIAKWHITSLDPMTMEPTNEPMDGVLPVNTNGKGIGEVSYDISLKPNLAHGTEVNNRAGIVFDQNDVIMTPTWTNIIDCIAPESHVADVQMLNDSTATVHIEASDELSGPWRYNVYVQYGSGAWFLGAENVPIDTTASVKVYEGINHGFYVVVTDSAGNVEQKEAAREFTFEVFGSQMDTNTRIELAQGWNWISHNQQEPLPVAALQPAGSRMVGQMEELIEDSRFGWMGDLEELLPTQMYKLQMDEPLSVQLSGRLFNAGFRSIPLYEGWNWMGYPVANTMTPAEALSKLEAEEGDMLIGQDGLATYSEGQWQGTLMEMNPGQGYMYRSASDKNLFLNATAQSSSRRMNAKSQVQNTELPEAWTVDKRKYPNVMGVIGQLWNGNTQEDATEWQLGAFCGDECRGISQAVNGMLMMNVYGMGGEQISFRVLNQQTGEQLNVSNLEDFRPEVLGTMAQPYELHIGAPTGMKTVAMPSQATSVYDLMGRRLQPSTPLGKGVYVVTDGEKKTTQKVIRR